MRNLSLALLVLWAAPALADDWSPPSPAEIAMSAPQIDPEADAEALLWDVRVAHEIEGGWARTELAHYLKIKVFAEAGRDRLGTVDIPYGPNTKISDVAGRTIKANGAIVELQKDSVYERTIVKTGKGKISAKSFALPGLEVGSIIEYRWRETIQDHITNYFRQDFQRDLPIHTVRYHVKPIVHPSFDWGMGSMSMNFRASPLAKEKDGFFGTSATRIPAYKEEKDMPPEVAVRPWMLIYYANTSETPERYWQTTGKDLYQAYRGRLKVNDEMRAAITSALQGVEGDEARLARLYDFVGHAIRNERYESDDAHEEERREVKENRTTLDTWKQKAGTPYEITLLFLALADALGYEARLARVAMRDFGQFDRKLTSTYFLNAFEAAVKVGGAWRFCDPGRPLLPFGMLDWNEQGQAALVTDPKRPELVVTPTAGPEASLTRREGQFRLNPGGDLEGDVRLSYTGHAALGRRYGYRQQSPAEREEAVRQSVKGRYAAAEVSDVAIEGFSGSGDLTIAYRVKVPGYAERTGRRLFLQCAYFNRNQSPRYAATDVRKYPVAFHHAWAEKDVFTYQLPPGYTLESPENPGAFRIGEFGEYAAKITTSADERTLRYERSFDFGRGGRLTFPAEAYATLKRVFDQLQELDNHTLALRQDAR